MKAIWNIQNIETVVIEPDFSRSGRNFSPVTAIEADGVRLINALEQIRVERETTQVEVCESCGIPHCAPGGWVSLRRIGDRAIWIPAYERMESNGWTESEYRPPSFFWTRGIPLFSAESWERLCSFQKEIPAVHALEWINSRETARLSQDLAPGHLLGEFPSEPAINRDFIVSVTDGNLEAEADAVDRCLQEHYRTVRPMAIAPGHSIEIPIEFWIDQPGYPGWAGFVRKGVSVCFLIEGLSALIGGE